MEALLEEVSPPMIEKPFSPKDPLVRVRKLLEPGSGGSAGAS